MVVAVVVVGGRVVVVVSVVVVTSEVVETSELVDPCAKVVPDSQPTQVSAGSAEGGWQVVSPVS